VLIIVATKSRLKENPLVCIICGYARKLTRVTGVEILIPNIVSGSFKDLIDNASPIFAQNEIKPVVQRCGFTCRRSHTA
jgi:hypothetical protein